MIWNCEVDTLYKDEDYDRCYECTGYGDDYYYDYDGDLISVCPGCPFNELETDDD